MTDMETEKINFNFKNILLSFGLFALVLIILLVFTNLNTKPKVEIKPETEVKSDMNETNEELKQEDLKVGTGAEAIDGKKVTVNYLGTLTDGKKFDSSYDRKEPFTFTLGAGEVIKGWDMGVKGMKVGGKRKLTIPASLGYGSADMGDIPPNSTLIFEVELLKVE